MRRGIPDAERQMPDERRKLMRREFLHRCAICAGVIALPPAWARLAAAATQHGAHAATSATPAPGPLEFKYLTPAQVAAIEAIAEQIIPADEDPGAKWAGVVHYIDLGLAGDLKEYRPVYEAGLKRLAALTAEVSKESFPELDFATQTKVLERLEGDDALEGSGASGREFFQLVRRHTVEGFFGDPKYGGNRETIGWKILKFEG
ncbi:MAG: gluconate 2-dehydrogenase subunit 3 family protein [Acidobacteriia bacterium]|nr:gluconate 2-dehydrogenase subunit 3 family protein [Terriglobia bacterium]